MTLDEDAIRLLQSMKRTDGRKYTAGRIDRRRYIRLEQQGLIKGTLVCPGEIVYVLLPEADKILHGSAGVH